MQTQPLGCFPTETELNSLYGNLGSDDRVSSRKEYDHEPENDNASYESR